MKNAILKLFSTEINPKIQDATLLAFRVLLSGELIYAHGLKKLGVGVGEAEVVPNPLNLPEGFNALFADAANLIFPLFVIAGLATLIIGMVFKLLLAVTLIAGIGTLVASKFRRRRERYFEPY